MPDTPTFTADQVAAVTTALRMELRKPPEQFSLAQFVGMIGDEIDALRAAGHGDEEIAAMIRESSGSTFSAADIDAHRRGEPERR